MSAGARIAAFAGVLVLLLGGAALAGGDQAAPVIAGAAMALSSVSVVATRYAPRRFRSEVR